MATRVRGKPEDILWPVTERTIEAIDHNFALLFKDLHRLANAGILPIPEGGTGVGEFTPGGIVIVLSADQLGSLPSVTQGFALISQGAGSPPAWGKIGLTTHVAGTLPIANGGTGQVTGPLALTALSPLTTKGDLLGHDGAAHLRVPVGVDGLFLKADSTQPGGLVYASGGGVHNVLQTSVHTDAETNAVQRGAIIVGATLGFNGVLFWLDGAPLPAIDSGVDPGMQNFWLDGEPVGVINFADPGLLRWRLLRAAPGVLRHDGTDVFWDDDTSEAIAQARVYREAHLSIASGAIGSLPDGATPVPFEAISTDTHGFFHEGSAPTRLTVPAEAAGVYLVIGQASWATSATGRKAAWLFKNGARFSIAEVPGDDGGLGLSFVVAGFVTLGVGDYVELGVRQDSGSPLLLLGDVTGQYAQLQMVQLTGGGAGSGGGGATGATGPMGPAGPPATVDPTLAALAAYNTDGFLVQSAADTFLGRILTGDNTSGMTVGFANGKFGNPIIKFEPLQIATKTTPTPNDFLVIGDAADADPYHAKVAVFSSVLRDKLSSNRTYYVRTDGNDANTGTVNSAGGAFLTPQKAINVVSVLDLNGFTATISVQAGTYTGGGIVLKQLLGGLASLTGDTTTPANVFLDRGGTGISVADGVYAWTVAGFKLRTTSYGISVSNGYLLVGKMEYAAVVFAQIYAQQGGTILCQAASTVTAGGGYLAFAQAGGTIYLPLLTLTGTPVYTSATVFARELARVYLNGGNMVGAATGTRYNGETNSLIQTYGGGASAIAGSVAGAVSSGAIYQ